ncbi:MAG: M16 family metallopeptidase [Myxococcota bacterium]
MHTHVLANGLRVVVHPRPVPLAALYLWIEAGSIDERPGEHGAAHFLEHMLFKGTPTRGVGEVPAAIESLGGDLNAYTSLESTVLHATVELDGWKDALDVLADMSQRSLLDPQELEREREVILEEVRGTASDPEEVLYEGVQSALYADHAYSRPILGTATEVAKLPRQALMDFWRREWGPQRAVLSIAGGMDVEQALHLAEQLFGSWAPSETRHPLPSPSPTQGPTSASVSGAGRQTRQVQLAWRGPPRGHADELAMELLALALGDGPGGLLPERLVEEGINLADPQGATSSLAHAGALTLSFVPEKGQASAQVEAVLATLRQVLAEGLDEELVGRVRAGMLADSVFEAETVDGVCWNHAHYWSDHGDPRAGPALRQRIASLTASAVTEAARRWLVDNGLVVGVLQPKAAAGIDSAVRKGLERPISPPRVAIDERVPNGPRLIVLPDQGDVVGISIQMGGGRLREPARAPGLGAAWSQMVTAGADGLSAGQLSAALDRTGGEVWGSAGRSSLALSGRFPADTALQGLSLALSALAAPEHDPQAWERVQEELQHDAESAPDYPSWVAERTLWSTLWPRHAWGRPSIGTPASIGRLTRKKIGAFHNDHLASDNVVIAVAGNIPTSRVRDLVEEWLSELPPRATPVDPGGEGPARSQTLHRTAPAEQAHLAIGVRGLSINDPDTAACQVLATVLGAQGGRLFMDLRESRGLAYNVWADHSQSLGGGVFEVGLATDPDRLSEASGALDALLETLLQTPPTTEEVRRAVRVLCGARATAQQRATFRAARLASAALFGLPLNPQARVEAWNQVEPQHVFDVAHRLLDPPRIRVRVRPSDPS